MAAPTGVTPLARPDASRPVSALRLAVVSNADPENPDENSGVPTGVLRGLSQLCDVAPVSAEHTPAGQKMLRAATLASLRARDLPDLQAARRRARNRARFGKVGFWVRSREVAARLAAAGRVDACIQLASEYSLPDHLVRVTLDDSTVAQAAREYPRPELAEPGNVQLWAQRQREGYVKARACCANTHWAARSIVADGGVEPERVHVVGIGRNHVVAPPAQRDWSVPRFLFLGADWQRKNGDAVVRAFREVRARLPAAELVLIGGHPRVDVEGVTGYGRLSFSRPHEGRQVEELLHQATCFVMPSWNEPAGIVYAEAGGAGLPSIGSSSGGAATMIGPGGVCVDPASDDELVAAMIRLSDGDQARALGAKARIHAELFTWDKVAERLIRALRPPGVDVSGLAEFL
jgi:glycosyltransferase involved in cell wall biosynthesis